MSGALQAIRERHWDRIKMEVAEGFDQCSENFTLKSVFHYELLRRSGEQIKARSFQLTLRAQTLLSAEAQIACVVFFGRPHCSPY